MAIRTIDDTSLSNIASAIRAKLKSEDTFRPDQMASAIENISGMYPDWEQIGYEETPESIVVGYEYALEVAENWDPTITNRQLAFRDNYNLVYFPVVDMSNATIADRMFLGCTGLQFFPDGLDFSSITTNISGFFKQCSGLKTIKIGPFGSSNSELNANEFANSCYSLKKVELDCSHIKYLNSAFTNCYSLTNLILINTDDIQEIENAFKYCYNWSGIDGVIELTFNNCYKFWEAFLAAGKDTNGFDLILNVPVAAGMGHLCYGQDTKVKSVTINNGSSNLTTLDEAFLNNHLLESVYIEKTSSVENFRGTFYGCDNLTNISELNMTSATITENCFRGCSSLVSIDIVSTGNRITNMKDMFNGCTSLEDVPVIDMSYIHTANLGVSQLNNMFYNCISLTDESLNNILESCANSGITGSPALSNLGFNSTNYPAADIQALDNYTDFIAAGWSIGYS